MSRVQEVYAVSVLNKNPKYYILRIKKYVDFFSMLYGIEPATYSKTPLAGA